MNRYSTFHIAPPRSPRHPQLWMSALGLALAILTAQPRTVGAEEDAPVVLVREVALQDVQPVMEFPTRIRALENIKVIPQVEDILLERRFNSGDEVKKGDLLYLIDPESFEIAVARREAELDQARADLKLAKQSLDRAERLREKKAVAVQTLDEYRANYDKARADVNAAEQAVDRAMVDLKDTRITAKADGVISHEEVSIGDLVGPTRGSLGTFDVVSSVRAHIHVDEKIDTAYYQRELAGEKVEFDFRLQLPGGDPYPHAGNILAFDNRVDPTTGTRTFKLRFPNPELVLTPGMSATVLVTEKGAGGNLAIPQQAVQQDQLGHYVLVVRDDNTLEQRHLILGPQVETWWLVEDNLTAGERIVVEGLQQVRPGVKVDPQPQAD